MNSGGAKRLLALVLALVQVLGAVSGAGAPAGAADCAAGEGPAGACCCLGTEDVPAAEPESGGCCGTELPEPVDPGEDEPCDCRFEQAPATADRGMEGAVPPTPVLGLGRVSAAQRASLPALASSSPKGRETRARPSPLLQTGRLRI